MNSRPGGALYSPALLALAVELAKFPYDEDMPIRGEARSRTCGSRIELSCSSDFTALGMRVNACAVGQAAAAIFAGGVEGKTMDTIAASRDAVSAWLAGPGPRPDWPRIVMLEPALPHAGRHAAILLPWTAAIDALSKG